MTSPGADHPLPRYLQLLWGTAPAGRRGPKPGLTIEQIAAAGVRVADAHGLAGVSMKTVADELSVTTMSLYRYLDAKDDLIAVMVDAALGAPPARPRDRRGWRSRLREWALAEADALVDHPWVVLAVAPPAPTPNLVAWTEAGGRCFDDLPLTAQEKFSSLLLVDGFVRNHVRQSVAWGQLGPDDPPDYAQLLSGVVTADTFPAITAGLPAFSDAGDFFTEELAFGLGTVLDGIAALVERRAAAR
jgi:AcrR family transcriptional regulator